MAITKDQFIQDAADEITNYPTLAKRFQIGDPLITQGLASMAAMLAQLSAQVEITTGEVYLKARDVTVLADASVKGVLPFGRPCIAGISVKNDGTKVLKILTGRVLRDQNGRMWRVTTGAQVAVGESASIVARQVELRTVTHTVAQNQPFYTIDLAEPQIGHIAEVSVTGWDYAPEFCNVLDGDQIYHIHTDENQVIGLVFGVSGLSGMQPAVGTKINISIYDTEGDISPTVGMAFYFEYTDATEKATMLLSEVTQVGEAPMDIPTMRESCSFPGIYSENAVYLSNFDFLVRKKLGAITFLSVWNERKEEQVREPGIDNINRLYVSVVKEGVTQAALQTEITFIITTADNSYRITFVAAIEKHVPLKLTLYVPSTYDSAAIKQAVRALILDNYGRTSEWAKRGEAKMLKKDIYDLLRQNVPALTQRVADISVDLIGDDTADLPEHFRYVTEESLEVLTETAN
ncbi:hypothetical protein [Pseudomonas sp. TWP3-2]|uniref:hypothetical protein n=1 Tax=Pseudomonas sp. TWP3-2 TaxID=2804574 RepID=UPI003CF597D7